MDKLANWILKTPVNGVVVAIICSLVPGMFVFGLLVLGLITLRKGVKASLIITVVLCAILVSMYSVLVNTLSTAIILATVLVLPVWFLAIVLRETISLEKTVLAGGALAVAFAGISSLMGLNEESYYQLLFCMVGTNGQEALTEQAKTVMHYMAQTMVFWPYIIFLQSITVLFGARWWQARAFNPGGFQQEFHQIRFSNIITSLAAILIAIGFVSKVELLEVIAMIAIAVLSIHGLSVIHWYSAKKKMKLWLLIPVYLGLVFVTGLVIPILIVLSLVDSFYPLRKSSVQS